MLNVYETDSRPGNYAGAAAAFSGLIRRLFVLVIGTIFKRADYKNTF